VPIFWDIKVRLILLTAPVGTSTALGGIAAGRLFAWCIRQWWENEGSGSSSESDISQAEVVLK
jgi:hypothetical protein